MPPRIADRPRDDNRNDRSGVRDELLSDPHSRRILEHLRRADGYVDVATLATHVVADLTDQQPEDVPSNVRRRVQTWLHHGQLPALDERGAVEYDPDRGVVRVPSGSSRGQSSGSSSRR